ncbi:MAG TPA: hypothetical protein VFL55_17265 [Acetobacteraceae bacterium]|nr:hypothetical protein [Acetobacteraceae bacterium]
MPDDGYVAWYQSKLWQLLPGIYRSLDQAAVPGAQGPLWELLGRLGAQAATVRRSIDRMWENQSLETCDDWAVPYIGDLLAARLVACLDAPAQRLDVAKTIYYRRRAGTLGVLEELAANIANRDARAVEFFRRLGRTRHQFDPPIGNAFDPVAPAWQPSTTYATGQSVVHAGNVYRCIAGGISAGSGGPTGTGTSILDNSVTWTFDGPVGSRVPAVIEGLAGANSRTPAGGFADLRKVYAASNASSAFGELARTADLRRGAQSSGWHNVSHLGVFVWWLQSFQIAGATPVSNGKTPACYSFDPSGREIPLYAPGSRTSASYGEDWISPDEWELPVAVRDTLWNDYPDQLYPAAFFVGTAGGGASTPLPRSEVRIHPERGVWSWTGTPTVGQIVTQYHFGFMSRIGAGGFPVSLLETVARPATITPASGGGTALNAPLGGITGDLAIEIRDSLTYAGPTAALTLPSATPAPTLVLRALDGQRPMIRWAGGGATGHITGSGGNLMLQGVWLQGADIVLSGSFDSVSLRLATLDPGTAGTQGALIGAAIDGMPLAPVHLWIEASIGTLSLERCIVGPIRTRNAGAIEQLTATDSIIQAIPTSAGGDLALETEVGSISLARCTVLGRIKAHRLAASECIFDDLATAEDPQHGCVRFSAYAQGSAVHAPYRCVVVPPVAPIFVSRCFGEPGYARLRRLADNAIINPQPGDTILRGAQNESEMGAFTRENIPLKKRGLAIKFEEYAPLGIYPVWIDAD